MSNRNITRREFVIETGAKALAIGFLAPAIGSQAFSLSSNKAAMIPITLDLSNPEYKPLTQIGGVIKVADPQKKMKPIIVSRTSESVVTALSSRCTHLGCELSLPENGQIKCDCHGSIFDMTGKATHGPAKEPLHSYSATLNGSVITITDTTG